MTFLLLLSLVNMTGHVLSPLRFYNLSTNIEHVIFQQQIDTINFHHCMDHIQQMNESTKDNHDEIIIFKDYRNISVLGTHLYISSVGWGLLVEIDETEAFSSIRTMQITLTLVSILGAIFILIFGFFFADD